MSRNQVFHLDEALDRVDHDRDIFQMLAELFMEHGPKDLAEIKAALAASDTAAAARSAHRLKGAILQFCAPAAFDAAQKVEELGKAVDLTQAINACTKLETEIVQLVEALRRTLDEGPAA